MDTYAEGFKPKIEETKNIPVLFKKEIEILEQKYPITKNKESYVLTDEYKQFLNNKKFRNLSIHYQLLNLYRTAEICQNLIRRSASRDLQRGHEIRLDNLISQIDEYEIENNLKIIKAKF